MSQTLPITLPDSLFNILTRIAELTDRTVGEVVASTLETTLVSPDLPTDLASEMAQMSFLSDKELWRAARSRMTLEENKRTQELADKRQRIGLSTQEKQEADALLLQGDRQMLLRAQAMALLKTRGHDVSSLLDPPQE